ncbi:MAG: hypothetical protein Kow0092_33160 [Deferrisomatales bacterium]
MTSEGPAPVRRRKTLRRRMVLTFAGLAVVPFVVVLGIVFTVARHDLGELQGASLAQEARLLAERVRSQLDGAARAAGGLASLPEVRAYAAGRGPYPERLFAAARRFLPDLTELEVIAGASGEAPVGPAQGAVAWSTEETLEYQLTVTDLEGTARGVLRASFDLGGVRRLLEWFRRGRQGRAVLFTDRGRRLAGAPEVPVPSAVPSGSGWQVFEAGDVAYFAAVASVTAGGEPVGAGWRVAVLQPTSEVYRPLYFVARQVGLLMAVFALVVIALAWRMADQFLRPILRIRHGAEIVSRINLNHRIEVDTGDELEDLAREFNRMAESLAGAYGELEGRVSDTTRHLQEERNRLATVLRTMAEGVIVANEAGEVTLMNPRARLALGGGPSSGIGSPLARILPAERLEFHLRRLRRRWEENRGAVEEVIFPLAAGQLLRGFISPVPGSSGERAGFLMVFRDVGSQAAEASRTEEALRQMPELLKGPLGTLRSLTEALQRHPEMDEARRLAFLRAVSEEIERLTERLAAVDEAVSASAGTRWTAVPSDPRELVQEAVARVPGVFARIEIPEGAAPPVLVEPFSWVAAVSAVLRWVAGKSSGWVPVVATLGVEQDTVVVTFRVEGEFDGDPTELEALEVAPAGEQAMPLGEAVRRNRGEIWTRATEAGFEVCLGLVRASAAATGAREHGIADDQPEFYDFDLFLPRPDYEAAEKLQAPLNSLEYVVFDSETTGLHPSKGDRLVSLSAVRIRRGRIQPADTFHTLINPERPIPPESIRFHGIDDAQVRDAPTVEQVLPSFYEYVGDAVLVAHNAAFDKKFLDLAAGRARLPHLENPVLDTLFLSYGIHKDFEGHNLDAIARRLGIEVEGRHTSMGDAKATAEVFLRLISLLSARGIHTLADAKAFCDRMLLLRWQSSRF